MDSIGGMLNPIGKMPKTYYKKEFCNVLLERKRMVYNGILMETIGISVMVSIVFLAVMLRCSCCRFELKRSSRSTRETAGLVVTIFKLGCVCLGPF